jgi:hypothetical protein
MSEANKQALEALRDEQFPGVFSQAYSAIITCDRYSPRGTFDEDGDENWGYGPHHWHKVISQQFALHPVVRAIINTHAVRPAQWWLLLLEWPHVSVDDSMQIAYTRNEASGLDFLENGSRRQTKTSIGKYVSRHWPHVPDHILRDWVGAYGANEYEIWDTKEGIIRGIELGPQSCMKSSYGTIPFNMDNNTMMMRFFAGRAQHDDVPWDRHPYAVYAPEFGWAMAVRLDKGKPDIVMGRALVQPSDKVFVRSYKRGEEDSSYSHTDERLEYWLTQQGYQRRPNWEGFKLLNIEHPRESGPLLPYLDGNIQRVVLMGKHFRVDEDGAYSCDNTDGTADYDELDEDDEEEQVGDCERCGDSIHEHDEYAHVLRDGSVLICQCCLDNHYIEVTTPGSRLHGYAARNYYIRTVDAVEVNGDYYDPEYLPDSIRLLENGEYAHEDDCVMCVDDEYRLLDDCVEDDDGDWHKRGSDDIVEVEGTWYKTDSDEIVECEDGETRLRDNCWESQQGKWYDEEQPQIEIAFSGTYHPDELQEMIDETN